MILLMHVTQGVILNGTSASASRRRDGKWSVRRTPLEKNLAIEQKKKFLDSSPAARGQNDK